MDWEEKKGKKNPRKRVQSWLQKSNPASHCVRRLIEGLARVYKAHPKKMGFEFFSADSAPQ